MILSDFEFCSDQAVQEGFYLMNNEARKASYGAEGGHGVAEYVLQCSKLL
jgi:hypothetical protein